MRTLLCAALFLAAACSKTPRYAAARSQLGYALEIPSDWRISPDPVPDRKPATKTFFVGAAEPVIDGFPQGAVLAIGRYVRRRADVPGGAAGYKDYEEAFLKPTRRLFGDDADAPAEKTYTRAYELAGKDGEKYPMHLIGKIYRAPSAYYTIEFFATDADFEKHRHAFDHAVATFKLPP